MKKTVSFALFALLCAAAGASSATVHIDCTQAHGKCVPPPAPPLPPPPPAPPAPPLLAPDGHVAGIQPPAIPAIPAMPAIPAPPPMPAIPAPPPAPKLPAVPAEAQAACASKAPGTTLTWVLKKGETMTGVCEREDGKMVFNLRSYQLD